MVSRILWMLSYGGRESNFTGGKGGDEGGEALIGLVMLVKKPQYAGLIVTAFSMFKGKGADVNPYGILRARRSFLLANAMKAFR